MVGFIIYFGSGWVLAITAGPTAIATTYALLTSFGFVYILTSGTRLSRLIQQQLSKDVFNSLNESFPQEERLLRNEDSINLPARYDLRGKLRNSWINVINPFRGLLVMGTPGSGKSYFIIQHISNNAYKKGLPYLFMTLSSPTSA